ncbi:LOW QUALITY PROTEIN: hypothetical protein HID58_026320 [Brassica napus]|uniref:Uncharacterized protein n=1 Tax=Brassica napus TaxID=3708 RepID=A0ABQ8CNK3_BRANA|nr:LOW QUALITY PROTEIN: hypothetical protein HID58_026320 [Brassica napus]
MVNASEVIKVKTLTIREIFAFLKQEQAQYNNSYIVRSLFNCIATIGTLCGTLDVIIFHVVIAKLRGLTSLMCPKCDNVNVTEFSRLAFLILTFLHHLSFHSKSSALQEGIANGDIGAHHEMPTPQCLLDIIGQTHKFRVKTRNTITAPRLSPLLSCPLYHKPLSTSNSGDNGDQFPGASVACESALGSTCSGGPSCEASAPNSAIGEKEVCKTQ